MDAVKSDDIIQKLLSEKCRALEDKLSGEVILIRASMALGLDDSIRREIENLVAKPGKRNQLVVVLETNGGFVEVVERISEVFRYHFQTVVFVIPNFAYSAGTVLTLSGDDIYMDYYSVLGPIDPQIRTPDGRWVPGIGYLRKYQELTTKASISMSELEFLVRNFDAAQLFQLEQAAIQSSNLIQAWLCEYKFKDWHTRETSGQPVDEQFKRERAKQIADLLGDPEVWNSHGRGIPLRVLQSEAVNLKIKDFGADPELNKVIREYYDLFIDYCAKIGVASAIHTKDRLLPIGG